MSEDDHIFNEFWQVAKKPLLAYAHRVAFGDAESAADGAIDAVLSFKAEIIQWWRSSDRTFTGQTWGHLLYRTKNRVWSARRKRIPHELNETEIEVAENVSDCSRREPSPHADLIQRFLTRLSLQDQQLISAIFADEQSDTELAESLGIPQNTLTKRKGRLLEELRVMFERRGIPVYSKLWAQCVAGLSEQARDVIQILIREKLSIDATAEKLGLSTEAVNQIRDDSLKTLRARFKKEGVPFPNLKHL